MTMSRAKEISILRLVIDLIKADNKIHREEVAWIEALNARYAYSEEELRATHDLTFVEAVTALQQLDIVERNEVIALLQEIILIDDEVDTSENLLLATIRMALQEETHHRVQLLTADASHFRGYDRQLIYLEQCDSAVKETIEREYATITQALRSCDIEFFFMPRVVQFLAQSQAYVNPAIELLIPTFSSIKSGSEYELVEQCHTTDFCAYMSGLMGRETMPYETFLMIKIEDACINDNYKTHFLCIDCSDDVVGVINYLVQALTCNFLPRIIPYEGCYRTFFDMVSVQSKQNYDMLLAGDTFYLSGREKIALNIRGSERKTLFALFLIYGSGGIGNEAFATLSKDNRLGREVIAIYRYFANEKNDMLVEDALTANREPAVITNLRDIAKRNSHIGYIKKAFTSIASLKDPQLYYPQNVRQGHAYNILLPSSKMKVSSGVGQEEMPLSMSMFL